MDVKKYLIIILLLLPCLSMAAIYRWIDDKGITHFSDKPHKGAATIKLPPIQVYTAPTPQPSKTTTKVANPNEKKINYTINFSSPTNQQTFSSAQRHAIPVTLTITPKLLPKHRIEVFVDGTLHTIGKSNFTLSNLDRGEHHIQAKIVSGNNVLATTANITFFVQQHSVLNQRLRRN